jgi:hypothetical protein
MDRILMDRMRRLEERMERDSERMRVDMRARQQALETVLQTTQEEVSTVRRDVSAALDTARREMSQALELAQRNVNQALQRLEGSMDRQGSHFGAWLLEVETRLDEQSATRAEDLAEMRSILEAHVQANAAALQDHEARLRALEQDRPPAA